MFPLFLKYLFFTFLSKELQQDLSEKEEAILSQDLKITNLGTQVEELINELKIVRSVLEVGGCRKIIPLFPISQW